MTKDIRRAVLAVYARQALRGSMAAAFVILGASVAGAGSAPGLGYGIAAPLALAMPTEFLRRAVAHVRSVRGTTEIAGPEDFSRTPTRDMYFPHRTMADALHVVRGWTGADGVRVSEKVAGGFVVEGTRNGKWTNGKAVILLSETADGVAARLSGRISRFDGVDGGRSFGLVLYLRDLLEDSLPGVEQSSSP
jgi:hypothetical protein